MNTRTDRRIRIGAGITAALLALGFLLGGILVLVVATDKAPDVVALLGDPYVRSILGFTLTQAGLSTLFSVILAIPLALALHRARFPGKRPILRLFLLPQALPVLVGALAVITVWGRNGVVSEGLAAIGLPRLDVYGLSGILVAHVFFNMPLAARLFVAALDRVPAEGWKLAGQLALPPFTVFRTVEWPALRGALPGAAALIFMLCVTSFTIVLVLGGGPAATTLEVAVYQALRYDFDPGRAIGLSIVQIVLTALVLVATLLLGRDPAGGFGAGGKARRFDAPNRLRDAGDGLVVILGTLFVVSPFAAILVSGLAADLWRLVSEAAVQEAAATSLLVAAAAASLSLLVSTLVLMAIEALRFGPRPGNARDGVRIGLETATSLVLVVSPVIVGAGWFLALRQVTEVLAAAPYVVVATNAVMAMPFIVRIVGPALRQANGETGKLAEGLGLTGAARFAFVDWPAMRRPLALAFAFSLALSFGDLGAIALFGSSDFVTLPYLLLQRMGSYRTADAAGLALILGLVTVMLMGLVERGFAGKEEPDL
ncbi:thiamine/thiamine pyrophosphate ABC transporter permease ThiP [Jiella avicenniae]|uniref:Thiamine/thiamine pyrophosphate ABC transporter permease ThiP n=1 Tax=Jiella avicenniae TaxID=2907202 RepID=A0A9X1T4A7_9HYPH|nr:thiamine/thiamine pyrophosphate ABC transporter permease ThiP [Jiella avicenniae]MCE7027687.1 thiamine/thiamine pyrophosphate ABC transporter permease ThiP [Jiella avicenniae]MCE7028729.1 thiamine/thiamine pyrophosphate ABC transporter permease ThiP [Jiella avicenniae]